MKQHSLGRIFRKFSLFWEEYHKHLSLMGYTFWYLVYIPSMVLRKTSELFDSMNYFPKLRYLILKFLKMNLYTVFTYVESPLFLRKHSMTKQGKITCQNLAEISNLWLDSSLFAKSFVHISKFLGIMVSKNPFKIQIVSTGGTPSH